MTLGLLIGAGVGWAVGVGWTLVLLHGLSARVEHLVTLVEGLDADLRGGR